MPRIQGLAESGILSSDKLLKTGEGYVFSVTIGYKGMTAGEIITLKDGLNDQADNEVVFVVPAAAGTISKEWTQGKKFDTGIFYNKGATVGQVYAELTFK